MEQYVDFQVDHKTLRGILHWPGENIDDSGIKASGDNTNADNIPAIVMCHGFCGTKIGLHRIFVKAARRFAEAGYAVLRFDFSGCGDSDGKQEGITLQGQVREARCAVEWLSRYRGIDRQRVTLLGLSLGGAVAALTAPTLPFLDRLVLWAPVARPWEDITGILGKELTAEAFGTGIVDFEGYAISRSFLESLREQRPLESIKRVKKPLLILHGTGDREITCMNSCLYRLSRVATGLQELTKVDFINEADHTFSRLDWEQTVFERTLRWLSEGKSLQRQEDPRCEAFA
ncbi:alpha/beta fold hydrolase [Heliobacterium chlorum]|uniref:Alpha/beta fold hydrolase n=1 Tax=Heliobacterium chlorum TaxID=2698 RepID=A0ABR7T4M9_HELCL|nr:alpha/beta fold hydrolase [Heliobacterium chlorum]